METMQLPEENTGDAQRDGVLRYYRLAKRAEWQVRDLPWGEIAPIPEARGGEQKQARRRDIWRSVIMQQLQADMFAVEMASQLLGAAPHPEARLYYSTMVQDEARHTEAWLKLAEEAGGAAERDPYLDQLADMFLALDTLEEKVFLMQVFFERLIIPRFRMIARASRGTILEDLCNRLTIDDGIHHRAGMAYERVLLEDADRKTKHQLVKVANQMMPIFVEHTLWRPKARAFLGQLMYKRDIEMLKGDLEEGVRLAGSLGIDVSDVELAGLLLVRRWPRKNDADSIRERQDALRPSTARSSRHDLTPWARAQESLTGVAVIPVAVVAADLELGEYELVDPEGDVVERGRALEEVFVPLAHTEGGLSASLQRGARAAEESGGFRTYVLAGQNH